MSEYNPIVIKGHSGQIHQCSCGVVLNVLWFSLEEDCNSYN